MTWKSILAATATALALSATPATAALFKLTYKTQDGGFLEAILDGELQIDGNIVVVNEVRSAFFNGVPGPEIAFVIPVNEFDQNEEPNVENGYGVPSLARDGSFLDMVACSANDCEFGFMFANEFIETRERVYNSSIGYGETFELFDVTRYNLSPVPLPAPLAMLIAGLGMFGVARHLHRRA